MKIGARPGRGQAILAVAYQCSAVAAGSRTGCSSGTATVNRSYGHTMVTATGPWAATAGDGHSHGQDPACLPASSLSPFSPPDKMLEDV